MCVVFSSVLQKALKSSFRDSVIINRERTSKETLNNLTHLTHITARNSYHSIKCTPRENVPRMKIGQNEKSFSENVGFSRLTSGSVKVIFSRLISTCVKNACC